MKKGEIYHLREASISSMEVYNTYKNKGLKLVCPCSIKASQELKIIEVLSPNLVMVTIDDNVNKIAMIRVTDLRK